MYSRPQRGYLISARSDLENDRKLYNSYDILIDSSTIKDNRWVGLMILGLLAGLLILMFRPFGFRAFLYGLEHNNIYSLLLLVCIIGISALREDGQDIESKGMTPVDLNHVSSKALDFETANSKQCLENHGINSPNIFAAKYGNAWNNRTVIDAISKYYGFADNEFLH